MSSSNITSMPQPFFATVLTSVSSDTEPSILLTFDHAKYIFNAGENTNRAFLQSRSSWKRMKGVFFTQLNSQRIAGLPGLLMSFADSSISELDIVGTPGLTHWIASMRLYTYRDKLAVYPTEVPLIANTPNDPTPVFSDPYITVYAIPVLPESFASQQPPAEESEPSDPMSVDDGGQGSLKRKREGTPDSPSKKLARSSPPPSPGSDVTPELQSAMDAADFMPSSLDGELAEEWRKLMISTMFPKTATHRRSKARSQIGISRDRKIANRINNEDDPEGMWRPNVPKGFYDQLPKYSHPSLSASQPSEKPALAYVVVGPRIRGKFDVAKADALGVPKSDRGKLTKGETISFQVKLGDSDEFVSRIVRPEECVGPSEVPACMIIIDCPTPSHIDSLLSSFTNSPFYSKFRSTKQEDMAKYAIRDIFHICGEGVLEDERYIKFMNGFSPDAHHIVASRRYSADPVTFTSAAYNLLRLNRLDPDMFSIPKFSLTPQKELKAIPNLPSNTHSMVSNTIASIRPFSPPSQQTSTSLHDLFHPIAGSSGSSDAFRLSDQMRQKFITAKGKIHMLMDKRRVPRVDGEDVVVIPLGTGSALPTKYRNVSSTLIRIPNYGSMLLDAGEGTWGQLCRQFGTDPNKPDNVWDVLRDLRCIFLSHVHGDHHMGITQLLLKRKEIQHTLTKPLYLVALRSIQVYLREMSDLQDLGLNDISGNGVITLMSEGLHWKQNFNNNNNYNRGDDNQYRWQPRDGEEWIDYKTTRASEAELCKSLGLKSFRTVDVRHRTKCFGAVIKHTDNWSIVFSGDTMPADALVYAGQGATLLIHEATMADDQAEMADRKAHSTVGQAVTIGERMNADIVLLTHFSARYPKMPPAVSTDPSKSDGPIIGVAFDHARLRMGDIWKLNFYLPALQQNFVETAEEGDDEDQAANVANVVEVNL